MTDAFATLGLTRDADERAIKRAYAALLRVHRPDDDPVGFQRINDAYQRALDWRRAHPLEARVARPPDLGASVPTPSDASPAQGDPASSMPMFTVMMPIPTASAAPGATGVAEEPQTPGPSPTPASHGSWQARFRGVAPSWTLANVPSVDAHVFDVEEFLDQVQERALQESPGALRRWLEAHPGLFALGRKQSLAPSVVQMLEHCDGIPGPHIEILLKFFGLDMVDHGTGVSQDRILALLQRANPPPLPPSTVQRTTDTSPAQVWMWVWLIVVVMVNLARCVKPDA